MKFGKMDFSISQKPSIAFILKYALAMNLDATTHLVFDHDAISSFR